MKDRTSLYIFLGTFGLAISILALYRGQKPAQGCPVILPATAKQDAPTARPHDETVESGEVDPLAPQDDFLDELLGYRPEYSEQTIRLFAGTEILKVEDRAIEEDPVQGEVAVVGLRRMDFGDGRAP